MLYGFGEFLYDHEFFMLLYKCIKLYRTASQFFGFYPKFIQGKKLHKIKTDKKFSISRKMSQKTRKLTDRIALSSNKIQSQNYTFVIPLFLLIQKLYEKSAVSHAHRELKKIYYIQLVISVNPYVADSSPAARVRISPDFCGVFIIYSTHIKTLRMVWDVL